MNPNSDSPNDFEVTAKFGEDVVVFGIRGEVDIATAPDLGALLGAVIDQGHTSIALDLADLDFMGSAGLAVIASGVSRLGAIGQDLTIRSAPGPVIRLLEITGLSKLVRLEEPEETSESPPVQATLGVGDLTGHLRQVTDIPVDHDAIDSALQLVVSLARSMVAGADGVSVSLQRHGRLATVAATDQTVLEMDAGQYATGEGPCVAASSEGRSFHIESLDQETRWPSFTPKARELGIEAILSNPLLVEERPLGALNIYSRTPAAFSDKEQQLAAIFASEASLILRDTGADVSDHKVSVRLQEALRSRQVIARAEGVVMEREGISANDAYRRLIDFSRTGNQPLRQRAADVVDSARRPKPNPSSESEDA
jgi:anti-anti-sigma factor